MSKVSRSEIFRKLRDEGLSYEQIGRIYGISRQAVHQALTPRDGFRESAVQKIPYIGLREWMLSNRITLSMLDELIGTTGLHSTFNRKYEPRKRTIDAILTVTGLTYEECFREKNPTQDN